MKKEYNVKPKERHYNVARKIKENPRKTLGSILKEEGYGKSTQKQPTTVTETKGFKMAERDIIKQLEELEQDCVSHMKKKIKNAPYGAIAINRKHIRDQIWEAKQRIKDDGELISKVVVEIK